MPSAPQHLESLLSGSIDFDTFFQLNSSFGNSTLRTHLRRLGISKWSHYRIPHVGLVSKSDRPFWESAVRALQFATYDDVSSALGLSSKQLSTFLLSTYKDLLSQYHIASTKFSKSRHTLRLRYGSDNVSAIPEIQQKRKSTCQRKYGAASYLTSPEGIARIKSGNLVKFGFENPASSFDVRKKMKATLLSRYGVSSPMLSPAIKRRVLETIKSRHGGIGTSSPSILRDIKASMLALHGVEYAIQSEYIRPQIVRTLLRNHGVSNPASSPAIMSRAVATSLSRHGGIGHSSPVIKAKILASLQSHYGVIAPLFSEVIRERVSETRLQNSRACITSLLATAGYSLEGDFDHFINSEGALYEGAFYSRKTYQIKHLSCGRIFPFRFHTSSYAPHCPHCYPPTAYRSRMEVELEAFIRFLGFDVVHRKNLIPLPTGGHGDLDLFIPSRNIGFEVNGLYYHSINPGPNVTTHRPSYHQDKTRGALSLGIRLYHLWSYQSTPLLKSFIRAVLGKPEHIIYARNTSFKLISASVAGNFYALNHLHSSRPSLYNFGLFHNDQLVAAVSFQVTGSGQLENTRFSVLQSHHIPGAFSKLLINSLRYFVTQGLIFPSIITYADADLSPDPLQTVYARCGFSYLSSPSTIMRYTDFTSVWDRRSLQKKKLLSPGYLAGVLGHEAVSGSLNPTFTEQQILSLNRIYPFYNSGLHKYSLSL